ncbi:hypothetical protein AMAG_14190 [Allomyces macrogynus ATCC 38327]|uniref:Uncharacterized protein n=1 Tax=Allomyces macrogynus (strain ATCC 38327) TaxID=578462 RepID=A0A0L0T4I1_ALLM3|nr:hypothetical protein AMAG_14190 [Allomyces macrogynus ATCC 38327]|eukprot:KNE69635.1 hypothetical protein AMAG_14190 [Allomyces macrogynus ATCC 38327]
MAVAARSPSPEVPSVPDVAANVDLASPMLSGPFSPYPTVEKPRPIWRRLVREERRVDDALRDMAARQFELAERLCLLTAQRDRDRECAEFEQMACEAEAAARAFQRGGATDEQYGGYVERMRPYVRYVTPNADWFVTQVDGRPAGGWPRSEQPRPGYAAR